MWKVQPKAAVTARTISGGVIDPPPTATRTEATSRGRAFWASSRPTSMVGTPRTISAFSASTRSSIRPGSNSRARIIRPPVCTAPRVASTHPATWNIGMKFSVVSPGAAPSRRA